MLGRRSRLPLLCVLALVIPGCGSSDDESPRATGPKSFELVGQWRGRLEQKGLTPFRVDAEIRTLERRSHDNSVRYSGIDCSGNWTYLGERDEAFRFREVIDRGRTKTCKGVGHVSLTPLPGDRLRYEFAGGGIESRGILSRVG